MNLGFRDTSGQAAAPSFPTFPWLYVVRRDRLRWLLGRWLDKISRRSLHVTGGGRCGHRTRLLGSPTAEGEGLLPFVCVGVVRLSSGHGRDLASSSMDHVEACADVDRGSILSSPGMRLHFSGGGVARNPSQIPAFADRASAAVCPRRRWKFPGLAVYGFQLARPGSTGPPVDVGRSWPSSFPCPPGEPWAVKLPNLSPEGDEALPVSPSLPVTAAKAAQVGPVIHISKWQADPAWTHNGFRASVGKLMRSERNPGYGEVTAVATQTRGTLTSAPFTTPSTEFALLCRSRMARRRAASPSNSWPLIVRKKLALSRWTETTGFGDTGRFISAARYPRFASWRPTMATNLDSGSPWAIHTSANPWRE